MPLVLLLLLLSSCLQCTRHCKPLTSSYLAFTPFFLYTQALSTTLVLFIVSLSSTSTSLILRSIAKEQFLLSPFSSASLSPPEALGNNKGEVWMVLMVVPASSCVLALAYIHTHAAWSKTIPYVLRNHNRPDCNYALQWLKYSLTFHVLADYQHICFDYVHVYTQSLPLTELHVRVFT